MDLIDLHLAVPPAKVGALYAFAATLLDSSAPAAVATGNVAAAVTPVSEPSPSVETAGTVTTPVAAPSSEAPNENIGKRDAAGTLFDPARHTGSIVKSGLWRMKAGMSRGPGEGEDSPTYVNPNGTATPAPAAVPTPNAAPSGASAPAEDDEFAAFYQAASATPATAPAARTWADADLSKLCNQAALVDGKPDRVKAIISEFGVQHSRMIPAEQREAFAQKVEQTFGITYEG